MSIAEDLVARNAEFATQGYTAGLRMMPSLRTIVIGCVDPRVDPQEVLGLRTGEAAVIRNVAGRVTPAVLDELAILQAVSRAAGGDLGPGWNLVVLQHTDCGITRVDDVDLLAGYLGVRPDALGEKSVTDPRRAVLLDLEVLAAETSLAGATVTGFVYDVGSGLVDPVVPGPA